MQCDEFVEMLMEEDAQPSQAFVEHQQQCFRCRALVDVLSPLESAELLNTAPPADPYLTSQAPSSSAVQIAHQQATRLRYQSPSTVRHGSQPTGWKYIAAFLAGAAASLLAIGVFHVEAAGRESQPASVCLWEQNSETTQASQQLVQACVTCHLTSVQ